MATSLTDRLANVEAAIAKAEIGQSFRMSDGRMVARGDLKTLYAERNVIEKAIARAARGGGISIRLGSPLR